MKSPSDLSDRNLSGFQFEKVTSMCGERFRRSNLSGLCLNHTEFRNTDFRGADLSNATVEGCNFSGADFTGANLQGVDFSGANVMQAVVGDGKYVKSLLINQLTIVYTFDSLWIACTKIPINSLNLDASSLGYSGNTEEFVSPEVFKFSKIYGAHPSWNASHPDFIKRLTTEIEPALKPQIL